MEALDDRSVRGAFTFWQREHPIATAMQAPILGSFGRHYGRFFRIAPSATLRPATAYERFGAEAAPFLA
jgi:hypothetical protein